MKKFSKVKIILLAENINSVFKVFEKYLLPKDLEKFSLEVWVKKVMKEEHNFEVQESLSLWVKLGFARPDILSWACWALLDDFRNLSNVHVSIWVSERILCVNSIGTRMRYYFEKRTFVIFINTYLFFFFSDAVVNNVILFSA